RRTCRSTSVRGCLGAATARRVRPGTVEPDEFRPPPAPAVQPYRFGAAARRSRAVPGEAPDEREKVEHVTEPTDPSGAAHTMTDPDPAAAGAVPDAGTAPGNGSETDSDLVTVIMPARDESGFIGAALEGI